MAKITLDFHNWGLSYTKLGRYSVLNSLKVNRILIIGPLAIGWWIKLKEK